MEPLLIAAGALAVGAVVGLLAALWAFHSPAGGGGRPVPFHWTWFVAAPPLAAYLSAIGTWLVRGRLGIRNYELGTWIAALIPLSLVCWVPFLGLWAICARRLRPDRGPDSSRSATNEKAILGAGLAAGLLGIVVLVEQGVASGNPPLDAVTVAVIGAPFLVLGLCVIIGLASVGAWLVLGLTAAALEVGSSR